MNYKDAVRKLVDLVGFEVELYDKLKSAKEVLQNKSYDVDIDIDIDEINKALDNIKVEKIGNNVVKSIQLSKELKNSIGSFQKAKKIMIELAKTIVSAKKELLNLFQQLKNINKDDEYKRTIDVIIKFLENNKFDNLSDEIRDVYLFDDNYWNNRLKDLSIIIGYYVDGMTKLLPIYKELIDINNKDSLSYLYSKSKKSSKIIKWLEENPEFKKNIVSFFETIKNVPSISSVLTRRIPKDQAKVLRLDDDTLRIVDQPISPLTLFGIFIQHSHKLHDLSKQPITITNIKTFTEELKKFSEQINRMIDERLIEKMDERIGAEKEIITNYATTYFNKLKHFAIFSIIMPRYNKIRTQLDTFRDRIDITMFKVEITIDEEVLSKELGKLKDAYNESKQNEIESRREEIKDKLNKTIEIYKNLSNNKEKIAKTKEISELNEYVNKVKELCKTVDELNKLMFNEFKYKEYKELDEGFKETKSFMIWVVNTLKLRKFYLNLLEKILKYGKEKDLKEKYDLLKKIGNKKKSAYNDIKQYKEAISKYKEKFFEKKFKKLYEYVEKNDVKNVVGSIFGIMIDYQKYMKQLNDMLKKMKKMLKKEE